MKIILFGSNGMLGSDLAKIFDEQDLYKFSKAQADITSKESVFDKISSIRPNVVINAAAYTDVDKSETDRKEAMLVNATAIKYLALACKKYNCHLVHFSTDYIFNGASKKGYKENSKSSPINFYGKSKLTGEKHLQNSWKKYYIVRTQWLYGHNGKNFVESVIRFSEEKKQINVVDDQFGSPTYTKDIAKMVKILISNYNYGIYHITNSGICSWFEFAKFIIKSMKSYAKIVPIKSKELNRIAKRPKYSILLNTKFRYKARNWKDALKDYIATR